MGSVFSRRSNSPPPSLTSNYEHNDFLKARFYANYIKQNFSLPDSLMHYVSKNPKSETGYHKMVRSCKYFFVKNPIIVCTTLMFKADYGYVQGADENGSDNEEGDDDDVENDTIDSDKSDNENDSDSTASDKSDKDAESDSDEVSDNASSVGGDDDSNNDEDVGKLNMWQIRFYCPYRSIDITKIAAKFWLINEFDTANMIDKKSPITYIRPSIFRCEAKFVEIIQQNISFNEYIFVAQNAVEVSFHGGSVKDDDGSFVAIEKLVEHSPKAIKLHYLFDDDCINISSETVNNLLQVPRFLNLVSFSLKNICDNFDVATFFAHIKQIKCIRADLHFSESISDAYKAHLESIIDEILAVDKHDYKAPLIFYHGLDNEKYQELYSFYLGFFRK